ncbi:MAG: protein-glutamate O-methyltransferase CheR [Deltaproteobacteria bacterium]|nr:protein-glutamate O-methyltransferase CheR [Deltaproteobacteria bacterium]MBN2673321.1 protein-glutamate O-methyltransferase CheR [Deltaproteobacteria bacterium]
MKIKITDKEFLILKEYIETHCGIALRNTQKYLFESRLSKLVAEHRCNNFTEFSQLIHSGKVNGLQEKIVNAMTTNETLWFRDNHPWQAFSEHILPTWASQITESNMSPRIWSAASSTGQEAYSISMLIHEYARLQRHPSLLQNIEIVGTDISTSALYVAISGNYDEISMTRGFIPPWDQLKTRYFTHRGRVWEINPECKKLTRFRHFNLQETFRSLGKFDMICLRNVIIYFADDFKRELFRKMESSLNPGGYLLLGASETPIRYTDNFKSIKLGISTYYQLKG